MFERVAAGIALIGFCGALAAVNPLPLNSINRDGPRLGFITIQPPSPADLNVDGHVNGTDLAILLAMWAPTDGHGCNGVGAGRLPVQMMVKGFPTPCHLGDLSFDGLVDGVDLAILLAEWTG